MSEPCQSTLPLTVACPWAITEWVNNVSTNNILLSFQGAAFGFNVIAAKAGEQLAPFLPQLLPRLYRYQFDPNLGIRQAMTSIWNALVTDKSMVSDQQSAARGFAAIQQRIRDPHGTDALCERRDSAERGEVLHWKLNAWIHGWAWSLHRGFTLSFMWKEIADLVCGARIKIYYLL